MRLEVACIRLLIARMPEIENDFITLVPADYGLQLVTFIQIVKAIYKHFCSIWSLTGKGQR